MLHVAFLYIKSYHTSVFCFKQNHQGLNIAQNKKVLLRERKRHTARRVAVASACYFGGGVPPLDMGWGTPPRWDTPPSKVGVPPQDWYPPSKVGVPPRPRLDRAPPSKVGVPPHPRLDQVPPPSKAGSGTPPPKKSVDRLKQGLIMNKDRLAQGIQS